MRPRQPPVFTLERWAVALTASHPWLGFVLTNTIWPCLFLGFFALVLVFPDGPLPGLGWRVVAWMAPITAVLLSAGRSLHPSNFTAEGGPVPGPPPISVPLLSWVGALIALLVLFLGVLVAAASSLVVRFRRGDALTRLQVR